MGVTQVFLSFSFFFLCLYFSSVRLSASLVCFCLSQGVEGDEQIVWQKWRENKPMLVPCDIKVRLAFPYLVISAVCADT